MDQQQTDLREAYRQWLQEQPHDTPVETIEDHVARFADWLLRNITEFA